MKYQDFSNEENSVSSEDTIYIFTQCEDITQRSNLPPFDRQSEVEKIIGDQICRMVANLATFFLVIRYC